uniref:Uncharacterized protein n=1 Tax=Arundo donax TaxID=35708 RepID=A0A0A9A8U1_ARUDO
MIDIMCSSQNHISSSPHLRVIQMKGISTLYIQMATPLGMPQRQVILQVGPMIKPALLLAMA